jgi:hypothetical protein
MAGTYRQPAGRHTAVCHVSLTFLKAHIPSYFKGMKNRYVLYYIAAALFLLAGILSFVANAVQRGSVALVLALGMVLAGYRYQRRNKILD